jgi:UDP-3-O-[3-hydroxymyristoyl] N-acetylglucosamine deacetylase
MNNRLLRELLSNADAYETVSFEREQDATKGLRELAPAW